MTFSVERKSKKTFETDFESFMVEKFYDIRGLGILSKRIGHTFRVAVKCL